MDNTINTNIIPASASLDVTTLLATPSTNVKVERANNGVIAKMPVLIGKTIIQLYVDALANFDEPALEITNIKHDLNLTGCEFIQVESATKGKLIMSGFIREYIDYTVANVGVDGLVSIGSRRTGMDIPFKCFTKIELDSEPALSTSDSVLYNEEELITPLGANENYLHYSSSNEGLNFEVVETKIRQVHVKQNTDNVTINNYGAETFSSLSINMALDVALIILQDQFVAVSASGSSSSSNQSNSNNSSNSSSNSQSNNGKSSSSNNSSNNNNKGNKKSSSKWSKYGWMKLW